jgi:hypothetical protein
MDTARHDSAESHMDNETINENSASEPRKSGNRNLLLIGLALLVVIVLVISFSVANPAVQESASTVEGCFPGDRFSQTTGEPCGDEDESQVLVPCREGDFYNIETGEPCPQE